MLKPLATKTVVKAGGELEAGFGFTVNHGGGYSYRLCRAGDLSEECFQTGALTFATPNHTIRWIDGSKPDLRLPAMTIRQGTTPAGSEWRRIPFPACNCDLGEGCFVQELTPIEDDEGDEDDVAAYEEHERRTFERLLAAGGLDGDAPEPSSNGKCQADPGCKATGTKGSSGCKECEGADSCGECCPGCTTKTWGQYKWCYCGQPKPSKGGATRAYEQQANAPPRCPTGVQFPVPADDLYGYGDVPPVLVTDKLRVPPGLHPGEYVLSWRWDCEQTPQIWNSCADIRVEA